MWAPVSLAFHFRMKFVVGTMTIFPAYVLNAYLPGRRGIAHTPRSPCSTSSPWPYASPDRSVPVSPVYDTTTPTVPTSTTAFGTSSTVANRRFR